MILLFNVEVLKREAGAASEDAAGSRSAALGLSVLAPAGISASGTVDSANSFSRAPAFESVEYFGRYSL